MVMHLWLAKVCGGASSPVLEFEWTMKTSLKGVWVVMLAVLGCGVTGMWAQTDGTAHLETTLVDYPGSGDDHWAMVWVTTGSGTSSGGPCCT